ncbi:MAG: 2'-5' RNA ligase family protein, partial [Spirochaetales bacterium]|nr:2'-5' RNA ligase family protein [Spirochaetales bacterium]
MRAFRIRQFFLLALACMLAGCETPPPADGSSADAGFAAAGNPADAESFTLPGLGRAFVFASPNPVIYWNPQPDGERIQVQAALRQNFEAPDIILDEEASGTALELKLNMDESSVLFLRARRLLSFGRADDWTPVVKISYKPLILEMKSVGDYEMSVYEITNDLAAEIINRLFPGGELIAFADMIQGKDGTPYLGLGNLNYGFQFGLEMRHEDDADGFLLVREERGSHPLVGLSWYGAAFLCDSLSRMFGFQPAYARIAPGVMADSQADGFR